ncbi:hypothetical protein [Amycolatopsis minnesotensis]|uniref:Uncharacterized protein n=1 Tax=Amycolatopsis minnesotensis TaxID=337894 RepID=A0ABN2RD00_9PSEU
MSSNSGSAATDEPVVPRGFSLGMPPGFIALPLDEDQIHSTDFCDPFLEDVGKQFSLESGGDHAAATAAAFAELGMTIGGSGVDYAAVAYYKSPEDPLRPIMVTVTGLTMPSSHGDQETAVAGLYEIHKNEGRGTPTLMELPVGPAVALAIQDKNFISVGSERDPVLTRQFSAWIPDPDGTAIGVVSVLSNSWRDWDRVCVLGVEIFDTFQWEPIGVG